MTLAQMWRLARPWTLPASITPVLVGTLAGWNRASVSWPLALLMLTVALALQAATNMANEYYDFVRGIDDASAPGIAGVLVSGELRPGAVHRLALLMYTLAFVGGLGLAYVRGWPVLVLGLGAIVVSYLYSAGPFPLASTPLGEVVVGLLMGPLEVMAAEISASGGVSWLGLLASVPVACSVSAILLGNNLRDRVRDAERGRKTLVVLLGPEAARYILIGLIGASFLWCSTLAFLGRLPPEVLLTALALPVGGSVLQMTRSPKRIERIVPALGRFHLLVGALLSAGLVLARRGW